MRRVVLDTNIVLSALIFSAGRLAWIRQAWQQQQLQPLVCRETASNSCCSKVDSLNLG